MKTNWVERLWVNGPWRSAFLLGEVRYFKRTRELAPGSRVLEIGCGKGVGARLVYRQFDPARIDAVDVDPDMIRRAERQYRFIPTDRVSFAVADAQELPFEDRSMDAVFNFGILHHLEDWNRGIREVARVLRPGGAFYFEEIYPELYAGPILKHILVHPTENRFHGPQYRNALRDAGLRLIDGYHESRYAILAVAVREASS
ncbi:class I SAM-dependent methyltransferase [Salinispira pacifica]